MKEINAKGLACPQPLILTKKAVESSEEKGKYWLRKSCKNFYDEACEILNKLKKIDNE